MGLSFVLWLIRKGNDNKGVEMTTYTFIELHDLADKIFQKYNDTSVVLADCGNLTKTKWRRLTHDVLTEYGGKVAHQQIPSIVESVRANKDGRGFNSFKAGLKNRQKPKPITEVRNFMSLTRSKQKHVLHQMIERCIGCESLMDYSGFDSRTEKHYYVCPKCCSIGVGYRKTEIIKRYNLGETWWAYRARADENSKRDNEPDA